MGEINRGHLGKFSMFDGTEAPTCAPQAGECRTAARHFLHVWPEKPLCDVMRHLKVHLVQHDILWH